MTRRRSWVLLGGLGAALVLVSTGCGGGVKPVRVSGTVTLDDKPLDGATVTFSPIEGKGRTAGGVTDRDGHFELTTFNSGDGALPGKYQVMVDKQDTQAADEFFNKSEPGDPQERWKVMQMRHSPDNRKKLQAVMKKAPPSPVPAIYRKVTTTPLELQVPTDGPVQLKLDSKVKQ